MVETYHPSLSIWMGWRATLPIYLSSDRSPQWSGKGTPPWGKWSMDRQRIKALDFPHLVNRRRKSSFKLKREDSPEHNIGKKGDHLSQSFIPSAPYVLFRSRSTCPCSFGIVTPGTTVRRDPIPIRPPPRLDLSDALCMYWDCSGDMAFMEFCPRDLRLSLVTEKK